ncbi:MAG: hypothetical protein G01um101470_409 [Parcubacteria group bacterium Gr01-1014_70]|nr:MAG: hypothetical protein G01um101470_409 [Parcubacteria group bacterium Gr01-1014_70]
MFIGGILLVFGLSIYTAYVYETQPLRTYEKKEIQIGNASLNVFVADTPEKRTRGLMGVSHLAEDAGMLFIFSDSSPRTFWNKNTLIDLDLLWISENRVVGISALPSISQSGGEIVSIRSPKSADKVVEMNAGWAEQRGVKAGDGVEW